MPKPLLIAFEEAAAVLTSLCVRRGQPVVVVGITGPVGAGKSLLARELSPCVVSTDSYLPNYDELPCEERDLPHRADFQRLARDLRFLKEGRDANVPVWSFHSHRREGFNLVRPNPIVVCEGIHALYEPVRPVLDVCVFVEASASTRLHRWQRMAAAGERGWGVEETTSFFHCVAEPTFALTAHGYRDLADVLVQNERELTTSGPRAGNASPRGEG
ncbi:MAG: hypothetical protein JSR77_06880 [Planctomycetes bacterium]|nr:hypothetical protein [Planctomycetota bacterium]